MHAGAAPGGDGSPAHPGLLCGQHGRCGPVARGGAQGACLIGGIGGKNIGKRKEC